MSSGSSLIRSVWTMMPLLTAVTPQSAYQRMRLFIAPDLNARHIALSIAGDRGDLAGDESRRAAGRIDIGEPNLAPIKAAALHEGGPLHKLGPPSWTGNGLALQILWSLNVGLIEHHDRGRVASVDSGHHLDAHPFRYAIADHKTVCEAELRRLAGDELGGAPRALTRTDFD